MNSFLYMVIRAVFNVVEILLLIRVFISWLPVPREHKLVVLLYQVTEPILAPIRSMIERASFGRNMMFDFSPIVAFLLLGILRHILLRILF